MMAVTQEEVDAAFEERKQQYINTVVTAADRLLVGCEDYCEKDGVSLMHRNNLWALLEADQYPEIRSPMIWNMLIGNKSPEAKAKLVSTQGMSTGKKPSPSDREPRDREEGENS